MDASQCSKPMAGDDYVSKEPHLYGGSVSLGSVSGGFSDAFYGAYAFRKVAAEPRALCCRCGEACRGRQPGSVSHPLTVSE